MTGKPSPSIDFLGVPIAALDDREAASAIAARPKDAPFAYVVTPNAQHLVGLARNVGVWRQAYADAWLRLCDGRIVQRLARLLFGLKLPFASGSDLTLVLVRRHIAPDDAIAVIGGNEQLADELRRQYGWRDFHLFNPPFGLLQDPAAQAECLDFLARHPARYVFFTVGSPQSEFLAHLAFRRGGLTGTGLCVGSSLFFATGLVSRAPGWMSHLGIEALFRLGQRPRSHLRRIFVDSLPIVPLLIRARLTGARILPGGDEPC